MLKGNDTEEERWANYTASRSQGSDEAHLTVEGT